MKTKEKKNNTNLFDWLRGVFHGEKRKLAIIVTSIICAVIVTGIVLCSVLIPMNVNQPSKSVFLYYYDGDEEPTKVTVTQGEDFNLMSPTKDGYSFVGWYQKDTNTLVNDDFISQYSFDADISVYAKWDITDPIKITFETNEGQFIAPIFIPKDFSVDLPIPETEEDYIFMYWCIDSTLTTPYNSGDKIQEDTILYAKWVLKNTEGKTLGITMIKNNGEENDEPLEINVGDACELPTPTRAGYVFKGWYADSHFNFAVPRDMIYTTDISIYAKWEKDNTMFTVTLMLRGGIVPDNKTTYRFAIGTTVRLDELPTPVKTGDTFVGWFTNEEFIDNAPQSFVLEHGVTLFAKYKSDLGRARYNVVFNGYDTPINYMYYEGDLVEKPETPPEMAGKYFDGWYIDEELSEAYDFSKKITGNLNLYPKWGIAVDNGLTFEATDDGFILTKVNNINIKSLNVPDIFNDEPVIGIADGLLKNSANLTKITIGSNVKTIGKEAFYSTPITSLDLPSSVISIGESAFEGCNALTQLTAKGETVFGERAFAECVNLTIAVLNNAKRIENECFAECWALQEIGLNKLDFMGEKVFYNCYNLTAVQLNASTITEINSLSFAKCQKLSEINLPKSVTKLHNGAFSDSGLQRINTGDINYINGAFSNCGYLNEVVIGAGVNSNFNIITTFEGCTNIESITVNENNVYWASSNNAVFNKAMTELVSVMGKGDSFIVPGTVTSIGPGAFFYAYNLHSISVENSNSYFKDINGCLYSKDGKNMIAYPCGKTAEEFVVTEDTETIESGCFKNNYLVVIRLADSVKNVKQMAFYEMSKLETIYYKKGTVFESGAVDISCSLTKLVEKD